MICLSCGSEFEYPKVLDDEIGLVMDVCPVCGSPDISAVTGIIELSQSRPPKISQDQGGHDTSKEVF
ncbi:MAG: hypothetical protein ACP5OC_08070 [Thermoplasmata archaeon]